MPSLSLSGSGQPSSSSKLSLSSGTSGHLSALSTMPSLSLSSSGQPSASSKPSLSSATSGQWSTLSAMPSSVVVVVGAAIRVLEAVLVFGDVRTLVDVVQDAVVIAIDAFGFSPGPKSYITCTPSKRMFASSGRSSTVGLKHVHQREHRADRPLPLVVQKVVAELRVDLAARQPIGQRRARVRGQPEARRARRLPLIAVAKRPHAHAQAERPKPTRRRRARTSGSSGALPWLSHKRVELELQPEHLAEGQLERDLPGRAPTELVLLIAADGVSGRGHAMQPQRFSLNPRARGAGHRKRTKPNETRRNRIVKGPTASGYGAVSG